ncbi:MAG: hypothetical protein ACOYY2_15285 [Actinomycetota bacterium]
MGTEAASRHGGATAGTAAGRAGVPGWPVEGELAPRLDHLPLPQLRAYRRGLAAEEGRVSYWRRLLRARIDLLAGAQALLLAELRQAETELSAYRRLLHAQLDQATQELVRRYQREPALALTALPALPDGTG